MEDALTRSNHFLRTGNEALPPQEKEKDRERVWPQAAVPFSSYLSKSKFRREKPRAESSYPQEDPPPMPLSGHAALIPILHPRPRGKPGGNQAVPPLPEGPRGPGPHGTRAAEPQAEGLATKSPA